MESPLRRLAPPGLVLIETMRWQPGAGFRRLPAHLARMARGAAAVGARFDRRAVDRALATALAATAGAEPLRVRLTLGLDGLAAASAAPLGPPAAEWTVAIAGVRLRSDDPWLSVKSSRREAYEAARAERPAGVDEAILLNERGEVCEGAITSVFADLGEGLVTPPLACGLLPGVLRAELIARGRAREAVLWPDDLARARRLLVGNALRGLIPARLLS